MACSLYQVAGGSTVHYVAPRLNFISIYIYFIEQSQSDKSAASTSEILSSSSANMLAQMLKKCTAGKFFIERFVDFYYFFFYAYLCHVTYIIFLI